MKEILDKKYYNELISRKSKLKLKIVSKLNNGEVVESRLPSVRMLLFQKDISILIGMFSRGDDKETLKKFYLSVLDYVEKFWIEDKVRMRDEKTGQLKDIYYVDYHVYMRWLLSLAILLEISDEKLKILIDLIKRDEIKDTLYDYLIWSRIREWNISNSMSLQKPENKIRDIIFIDNKDECELRIKIYLEKEWYKTHRHFGLYNSHKKAEAMFMFFGYWAFEVAAIVKIKDLDDSSFKGNKYYPDRLV